MASESLGRPVSLEESEGWIRQPGTLPGVFYDELIDSANPLIVHSRGIQQQVEKQYGKPAAYLPFCCYREFAEQQLVATAKQAARAALGVSSESVMVITLGMVIPSKGPMQCIDAVAATRQAGYPVEFHFVGSSAGMRAQLVEHANSLGILSAIHFSDEWVSESQYQQYLVAADFAIQLRDSFFGGLSGALLDCIASGLPTIANDDLAEALESPDYVLRIGDQLLSEDLSATLLSGIETQLHRDRLSPSRQAYQSEHSFETYALEMMRLLGLGRPRSSAIGQIHAA